MLDFRKFLVFQDLVYDPDVIPDIRPTDGLVGYPVQDPEEKSCWNYFDLLLPRCVRHPEPDRKPAYFAPYEGQYNTFDRFRDVFPNVTEAWNKHTVPE